MAAPTVVATVSAAGEKIDDSSVVCQLELRSNYVCLDASGAAPLGDGATDHEVEQDEEEEHRVVGAQPLHNGLAALQLLHVVPLDSVQGGVLVGCALHAHPPSPATSNDTAVAHSSAKAAVMHRHLLEQDLAIVLVCVNKVLHACY